MQIQMNLIQQEMKNYDNLSQIDCIICLSMTIFFIPQNIIIFLPIFNLSFIIYVYVSINSYSLDNPKIVLYCIIVLIQSQFVIYNSTLLLYSILIILILSLLTSNMHYFIIIKILINKLFQIHLYQFHIIHNIYKYLLYFMMKIHLISISIDFYQFLDPMLLFYANYYH